MPTLCLAVHGAEYPVTLRDSPSTRALVRQLPMTLTLAELNGNEKYARLPEALPTDAIQPGALQTGTSCSTAQTALFYSTKVSPLPIPILRWDK